MHDNYLLKTVKIRKAYHEIDMLANEKIDEALRRFIAGEITSEEYRRLRKEAYTEAKKKKEEVDV